MKNSILMIALCAVFAFTSCGSSKETAQKKSAAPFGKTYSMPCGEFKDTKDKFAAVGIYRGSSYQKGECVKYALENAKDLIRRKYHHTYNGMISDYSSTIGNNRGNDITTKIESAGDQVINAVLNDAYQVCTEFSEVYDDGMIECYVAIEIPKGELAAKVSKKVADVLTKEEKDAIKFDEYNYRKQMEERMQNYKEENR